MTSITFNVPQRAAAPRAAAFFGLQFAQILRFFSASAVRQADPAAEAASVRAMAQSLERYDPRFADDLYAAADRHEVLNAR